MEISACNGLIKFEVSTNEKVIAGIFRVKRILDLYNKGLIIPYEYNRGGASIDTKQINEISKNLHINSLGMMTIYVDSKDLIHLCDFHYRMESIKKYFENNPTAYDFEIIIKCVPEEEGMIMYQNLNKNKPHTNNNKLTNPDYAMGGIVSPILNKYNFNMKFATQFSNLLHMYGRIGKKIDFPKTFKERGRLSKYSNELGDKEHFFSITKLNDQKLKEIYEGIELYQEFLKHIQAIYKEVDVKESKEFKIIKSSASFFGYFVIDYLKEVRVFTNKPMKNLANHTFSNLVYISQITKRIVGNTAENIEDEVNSLDKVLSK